MGVGVAHGLPWDRWPENWELAVGEVWDAQPVRPCPCRAGGDGLAVGPLPRLSCTAWFGSLGSVCGGGGQLQAWQPQQSFGAEADASVLCPAVQC